MLVTNRGRTKINPLVQNVSWYSWGREGGGRGEKMEVKTDQMPQDPYHTVRYF